MGDFSLLENEESDVFIENDNQLRNQKKLLRKKESKYQLNPSESLMKEINILQCNIKEYTNRNSSPAKVPVKNKKSKKLVDSDEMELLNNIRRAKRERIKEDKIRKLWKQNENCPPRWSPLIHKLFPDYDKKCIMILLLGQNKGYCILSILPCEIMECILSYIQWDDFLVIKNKRNDRSDSKSKRRPIRRKKITTKLLKQ